tara:strand:+ start:2478 stop:2639 length:162 start_codon:yes stop_codon:yes gene_type:complete
MEALKQEISGLGLPKELKVKSIKTPTQSGGGVSKIAQGASTIKKKILPPNFME